MVLENDYVAVTIMPEIGGKVWGATDKTTGLAYIYDNDVVKFRDISLRGPWTSGGIEFNYGVVGHSPTTSYPVDYLTRENADGSASCIIRMLDLLTRTTWSVDIRLPADGIWFETNSVWHNSSGRFAALLQLGQFGRFGDGRSGIRLSGIDGRAARRHYSRLAL